MLSRLNLPKLGPVLKIRNEIFSSVVEVKRAAHGILHKYSVGSCVIDDDFLFLKELFGYHYTAAEKLNGMTGILVGVHKDGDKETFCFKIEKAEESTEISYIKAVNGFLQNKEATAEQDAVAFMQNSVNIMIDLAIQVLNDNPLMFKFSTEKVTDLFPHKSSETRLLKYFVSKLVAFTEKYTQLAEFTIKICIERLVEIEGDSDLDKLDQLMYIFLTYLHKNYSSESYGYVLSVFKSHILSTYQPNYIQHIIPSLCLKNIENSELFLSLLINEVFLGKNINSAAGYIASFLLIYPELSVICMKYLVYYCLKNIDKASSKHHVKSIIKYVLLLAALKSELLLDTKLNEKIEKILRHPCNLLKDLPLQEGLDYGEILSMSGYCGDLCYTSIYLPFHCEAPELKLSTVYFVSVQVCLNQKRRRRCMSIDLPKELQIKRRAYSID